MVKFKFFSFGDTTLKLKHKRYRGHELSLSNDNNSFVLTQLAFFPNGHFLIFYHQTDFTDNFNATDTSTNNYLFNFIYIVPSILPKYVLNIGLSISFLDTKEQSATRGTETTLNPSLKLTRKIGKHFEMFGEWSHSKKSSDSTTNKYSKHVSTLGLKYSF